MSTTDIARALGVEPQTVRLWRMQGRLPPAVLVAGRLRHVRRDVQSWALANGYDAAALGPQALPRW